jgi:hypothetical protein
MQAERKSRRVWCPAITEARLPARLTAVRPTPASIRDQADTAILARTEAPLRRHRHRGRDRHRRGAVRPRSAAPRANLAADKGAAGRSRQDPAAIRKCGHVERGDRKILASCPPFPLVSLFPRLFAYGRVVSALLFQHFGTGAFPVVDYQSAILNHDRQRNDPLFYLRVVNRVVGELI